MTGTYEQESKREWQTIAIDANDSRREPNGVNHGPVTRKGSRETKRRPWMEQRGERKPGKKKLLE